MIKPNKITLKAPDRQALIYDKKERLLMKQLRKDAKYLTKRVLNDEIFEDIEKYSEVISHYNSIEEVIRHLHVEDKKILNQYETRSQVDNDIVVNTSVNDEYQDTEEDFYEPPHNNFSQHNTPSHSDINSALNVMSAVSEALPSLNDITQSYENPTGVRKGVVRKTSQQPTDTKRTQQDQKFSSYVAPKSSFVKKEDMGKVSIRNIAKKSNIVWVEKKYHEEKKDMIALYEYYGVFTFISPHILYDRALQFLGVPHIDTVKGQAIEKQYNVKRTGALTKKEERVMEILQFIEKKLGLENTFFISDIHCKMIVSLREKKIYQEKLNVEGYAQGNIIHLNRKSLKYGKISSILLGRETLSIHDVKFVLSNLELIAHELAHLIYNTQDNTKEHFMAQNNLQEKIGKIIMDCDSLDE